MLIQNVEIIPVKPNNGLIGFASFLFNENLSLSSIGIYKKKNGKGYRILYPTKKAGSTQACIFHPITKELSIFIEAAICAKAMEFFKE